MVERDGDVLRAFRARRGAFGAIARARRAAALFACLALATDAARAADDPIEPKAAAPKANPAPAKPTPKPPTDSTAPPAGSAPPPVDPAAPPADSTPAAAEPKNDAPKPRAASPGAATSPRREEATAQPKAPPESVAPASDRATGSDRREDGTADGIEAVVLPAVTPLVACSLCPPRHVPDPSNERALALWAQKLESLLGEAVQDLGLKLDRSEPADARGPVTDADLVALARTQWVFSPRLEQDELGLTLELVAVPPGSNVMFVRKETIAPEQLEVHAATMMRDLVEAAGEPEELKPEPGPPPSAAATNEARSRGRAVLALNSAALGAYVGYSLQRASGSNDARLTYPLIALGTGIGLGGSMIVADEWDVGVGDAWYLSAGIWWPAVGAYLIADGYGEPPSDRHIISLGAGLGGLTLATVALTFGPMSDGGAVLTHSGGAYGAFIGGLTELMIRGETDASPERGLGVGAISGVVVAGAAARLVEVPSSSSILLVDLGLGLGALTGAAVASPLVFGETENESRTRLWLGAIGAGFVAGGVTTYLLTGSGGDESEASLFWPEAGVIGFDGQGPVLGGAVRGLF